MTAIQVYQIANVRVVMAFGLQNVKTITMRNDTGDSQDHNKRFWAGLHLDQWAWSRGINCDGYKNVDGVCHLEEDPNTGIVGCREFDRKMIR